MHEVKVEIQKSLEEWDFYRVKWLYESTFSKTDTLKMSYVEFLMDTRQLKNLTSFLGDFASPPSWWNDLYDFDSLKTATKGDCESIINSNLQSFDIELKDFTTLPILAQKFILKKLIRHYIKQNINNESFVKINLLLSNFDECGARSLAEEFVQYLSRKKPLARIAILVCGVLRGDYLSALHWIDKRIAYPLKADMFLFSWDKSAQWIGASGNSQGWLRGGFDDKIVALAPKEIICSNLEFAKKFPRAYQQISKEKLAKISENDLKKIPSLKSFKLENLNQFVQRSSCRSNTIKMFYGYAKALEVLESYEKKADLQYDYLVRIRPDMIYKNISLERILQVKDNEVFVKNYYFGVGDMIEIGKAKTLKTYLNTLNIAKCYQNLDMFKDYPKAIINDVHLNMQHRKAFWYYTSYLGFVLREVRVEVARNFCLYRGITLPNCKKQIEQDLEELCSKGLLNVKQSNAIKDFFELISTYKQGLLVSAVSRIRNHLAYKLGSAMISNSKSLLGYIRMPYVLFYIKESHKKEIAEYEAKAAKNPKLKLPKLESYADYKEALKEKECFTYKLGAALIEAQKVGGGGIIKFIFHDVPRIKREFRERNESRR